MRTWNELTEEEKKTEIHYEVLHQVGFVSQISGDQISLYYGDAMLKAVTAATEDCERLRTPWFFAQYLLERGQELFEAEALLVLESCLFRREEDPVVVTLHKPVSCRETGTKKSRVPPAKRTPKRKNKNLRSTKR